MSWKQLKDFYVYTYYENDVPYYVGMGSKGRVTQKHLYVNVPLFENIKILDGLSYEDACKKEIELISLYGREDLGTGSLKNLSPGGPTQKSGWKQSLQSKLKISLGNKGKKRSVEAREKLKKPKSKEHIENIRKANLGRPDDGRNQKISETMKGRPWSQARRDAQNNRKLKENSNVMA
jgi:hypothetical protein